MFNDKFLLTKAVLDGTKTMTRRVIKKEIPIGNWQETEKTLRYKVGEVVAVAQSYKTIYPNADFEMVGKGFMTETPGWSNKMFVKADLMPHHIKITDVRIERLQDITDEDCLKEGIMHFIPADDEECTEEGYGYLTSNGGSFIFDTPREAYAELINKICGKGTWERNQWVDAYTFEKVD